MALTVSAAIRRTRQELADARQRTEALETRLRALEDAAAELGADGDRRTDDAGKEARTDAILAVMNTQPTIAWTTAMLRPQVGSRRDTVEESKDIAAALSYLQKMGKVRSHQRGEWMLAGMDPEWETLPPEPDPDDITF